MCFAAGTNALSLAQKNYVQRYFLHLAYKGSAFHGWQVQPNAVSVQETLDKALSTILRESIHVIGAGRTDTGVHASQFFAHFDSTVTLYDLPKLRFKLNNYLPRDIAIYDIIPVGPKAHARFDARLREYQYFITREKNPFRHELAFFHPHPLDMEAMQAAADILLQYDDFSSFEVSGTQNDNPLCELYQAQWTAIASEWVFTIQANRFLRKMVRSIVGTLLDVGRGKLAPDALHAILQQKNRQSAGASAAPQGLFLTRIEYPEGLFPAQAHIAPHPPKG